MIIFIRFQRFAHSFNLGDVFKVLRVWVLVFLFSRSRNRRGWCTDFNLLLITNKDNPSITSSASACDPSYAAPSLIIIVIMVVYAQKKWKLLLVLQEWQRKGLYRWWCGDSWQSHHHIHMASAIGSRIHSIILEDKKLGFLKCMEIAMWWFVFKTWDVYVCSFLVQNLY